MINLLAIISACALIYLALFVFSLVLVAYANIGNRHLAIATTYLAIRNSLPARRKAFVQQVRSELTQDFYEQLELIMAKSDEELEVANGIKKEDVDRIKKEIRKILSEKPDYLVTEKEVVILLKSSNGLGFFSEFKDIIRVARSYYNKNTADFKKSSLERNLGIHDVKQISSTLIDEDEILKTFLLS